MRIDMAASDAFQKFDLTGKTAFVTGGSIGLGKSMARALAQSGAKVMIAARREDLLREAAAKLTEQASGNEVLYRVVDLTHPTSVSEAAEYAVVTLGGVDIFVGNAAMQMQESLEELTQEACDRMFQGNITANLMLTRAFTPHMRKNRWGRIIFSSSVMANLASPLEKLGTYTSVKGALDSFTHTAAGECGRDGITVNSLTLGIFVTEMSHEVEVAGEEDPGEMARSYISMTCLGRPGRSEEVEGLIQLLASDAGSYITGTNLVIDGGISVLVRPHPRKRKKPLDTE